MPPKHPKHRIKPADRLALAITGLKTGKYTSTHEAALQNAIPEPTLRARVKSSFPRAPRKPSPRRRKQFHLSRTEENTLCNWIIQVHEGGQDMAPSTIKDMANSLLEKRGGTHGFRVTEDWVSGYLEFHPDLAAILDEHRQRLEPYNLRPVSFIARPWDQETQLQACENFLHNASVVAKEQNWLEGGVWEKCEELGATRPDFARYLAAQTEGLRGHFDEKVKKKQRKCEEMIDLLWEMGVDCGRFFDGLEEIELFMDDTRVIREEICRQFGDVDGSGDEEEEEEEGEEEEEEEEKKEQEENEAEKNYRGRS